MCVWLIYLLWFLMSKPYSMCIYRTYHGVFTLSAYDIACEFMGFWIMPIVSLHSNKYLIKYLFWTPFQFIFPNIGFIICPFLCLIILIDPSYLSFPPLPILNMYIILTLFFAIFKPSLWMKVLRYWLIRWKPHNLCT